jgi:hypothetical protein
MKKDELKKLLINEIKKLGFPVAFVAQEADGYAGYYVENENKVIELGDYTEPARVIMDLSLVSLAMLIENGVRPTEKNKKQDWKEILEFKELAGDEGQEEL